MSYPRVEAAQPQATTLPEPLLLDDYAALSRQGGSSLVFKT